MKCKYCSQETTEEFCSKEHEENYAVFIILENITDELDLVYKATSYPWKVKLTSKSYDTLKNRPGTVYSPGEHVYERNGHEYLRCWENHNIPFIVHARIADKNAEKDELNLDDLNRPNIEQEYQADWDSYEPDLDQ